MYELMCIKDTILASIVAERTVRKWYLSRLVAWLEKRLNMTLTKRCAEENIYVPEKNPLRSSASRKVNLSRLRKVGVPFDSSLNPFAHCFCLYKGFGIPSPPCLS